MRGAWRPSNGRLYFGGGDIAIDNRLPDDAGPDSANAIFWSMDPARPADLVQETHRHDQDRSHVHIMGCDQGGFTWDTTRDAGIMFPVSAFGYLTGQFLYANLANPSDAAAGYLIPRFVAPNQFRVDGDWRKYLWTHRILRLHLKHPLYPTYTPDQWYYVPCWLDCRITDATFDGASTNVTFIRRPDVPSLSFTQDGLAITPADGYSTAQNSPRTDWCWHDNAEIYVDEASGKRYAGLLEWNPDTHLWSRRNLEVGSRFDSESGASDGPLFSTAHLNGGGVFVPASITGRNDEVIDPYFRGDGGWFGAYIWDLGANVVNFYRNRYVYGAPAPVAGVIGGIQHALDPAGKRIYVLSPAEDCIYYYDIPARMLRRLLWPIANDGQPRNPDSGSILWNADLGLIEVYLERGRYAGNGAPTLYLVDPEALTVHRVGNTVPPTNEALRGNTWFRAGIRSVAQGGQEGDPVKEPMVNRHIFIGGNLKWQELAVAPHPRIISYYGDQARTDGGSAVTCDWVPARAWGGLTISREGIAYYLGGGHGDYHGNEVDNCDLSQIAGVTMPWQQNLGAPFVGFRRPHTPNKADSSGYGNAGSNWMWFDPTDWQHDAVHMYSASTTHPTLGLLMWSGVPGNLTMPADMHDVRQGIKTWSRASGKWTAHALTNFDGNQGGFGDYNHDKGYLLLCYVPSSSDRTTFFEWSPSGGLVQRATISTPVYRVPEGCCLWLGSENFLMIRSGLGGAPKMWLYTHHATNPVLADIAPPVFSEVMSKTPENGHWALDHDHGKIWWLLGQEADKPRLFYAATSDPANLRELKNFADTAGFRVASNAISGAGMKGMCYWGGYLWMIGGASQSVPNADGRTYKARFWRFPVF